MADSGHTWGIPPLRVRAHVSDPLVMCPAGGADCAGVGASSTEVGLASSDFDTGVFSTKLAKVGQDWVNFGAVSNSGGDPDRGSMPLELFGAKHGGAWRPTGTRCLRCGRAERKHAHFARPFGSSMAPPRTARWASMNCAPPWRCSGIASAPAPAARGSVGSGVISGQLALSKTECLATLPASVRGETARRLPEKARES